jgi:Uri superfamily endonuclease
VKQPGFYSLIICLRRKIPIRIGKLGQAVFPAGTYIYTGSAMGGLEPRLKRHLRSKKKLHWHIDYLLHAREAKIREIFIYPSAPGEECRRNRRIAALRSAKIILPKFGASDCKAGCRSHLFYFAGARDPRSFQNSVFVNVRETRGKVDCRLPRLGASRIPSLSTT